MKERRIGTARPDLHPLLPNSRAGINTYPSALNGTAIDYVLPFCGRAPTTELP
jgi:hypothetical protein